MLPSIDRLSLPVAAFAMVGFLTQCETPPKPIDNYKPAAAYQGQHPESYRLGYQFGSNDARQGLTESYERYHYQYLEPQRQAFAEGYEYGYRNYDAPDGPPEVTGLTAKVGQGQITVLENGVAVSTIKSASPNIEAHHFTENRADIVVKSRGAHGPATVELFDARTGRLKDKVLAYAIRYGEPAWARGMQD